MEPPAPIPNAATGLAALSTPNFIDEVCEAMANGETVLEVCRRNGLRYSELVMWVRADPDREKVFAEARRQLNDWSVHRFLAELRNIALTDVRQAFLADGRLRPVTELPDSVARAVQSIEYNGVDAKVKFFDKLKALEMLGKHLKMFVEEEKAPTAGIEALLMAAALASKERLPETVSTRSEPRTVDAEFEVKEGEDG